MSNSDKYAVDHRFNSEVEWDFIVARSDHRSILTCMASKDDVTRSFLCTVNNLITSLLKVTVKPMQLVFNVLKDALLWLRS